MAVREALVGFAVMALSSCALLHTVMGYEDRAAVRKIQAELRCGMSVRDIETLASGHLTLWDLPTAEATHTYARPFAILNLVIREGKLKTSQVFVVDNLKSMSSDKKIEHCAF